MSYVYDTQISSAQERERERRREGDKERESVGGAVYVKIVYNM